MLFDMRLAIRVCLYSILLSSFTFTHAHRFYHPSKLPLNQWYKDQTSLRTYLFSFPRSGNTWMRYCLEWLTKRPTLEKMEKSIHLYNCPLGWSFDMGTDYTKPPIWKMHTLDWFNNKFKAYYPDQETLIFLVRNYKEVLLRHCGMLTIAMLQNKKHQQKNYFENLKLYDKWNPKKRLLIYYEDFMTDPKATFEKVLDFLGEEKTYLAPFMQNYEKHKAKSLEIYNICNGKPVTQGNSLIYHSRNKNKEELRAIDAFVQKTYTDLWEKYLMRYAE